MQHKPLIFLLLFLSGLHIFAQKRVKGIYDAENHQFIYTDPNILVKPFVNNRAAFMIEGADPFNEKTNKVGYIDTNGKVVIKPLYSNCSSFRGYYALVQDTDRRLAVINKNGEIIIPFARHDISFCKNGLFIVATYNSRLNKGSMCIVNDRNKMVVPPGRYAGYAMPPYPMNPNDIRESTDDVGHREYVWYQVWAMTAQFQNYIGMKKDHKWTVIDRSGKEVIPANFDWIGIFNNGLAPFNINKKYGVVDSTGKQLIPPMYDNLELSGGKFVIAIQNKKWGVLSVTGKILIPFKYDLINQMAGAAFAVSVGYPNGKWGVVNASGNTIIPAENDGVYQFGTGYQVAKDNLRAALFDSTGAQKTDYACRRLATYPVWDMCDQGFTVYNEHKGEFVHYEQIDKLMYYDDNKWGLLDSAGEEVTKPQYDEFRFTENKKIIAVQQNKKWFFINSCGKRLTPDMFDDFEEVDNYFISVKKDGQCGVINRNGKVVIPFKYDAITISTICGPRTMQVFKNGLTGLIDYTGKVIYPCKYTSIHCADGKIVTF